MIHILNSISTCIKKCGERDGEEEKINEEEEDNKKERYQEKEKEYQEKEEHQKEEEKINALQTQGPEMGTFNLWGGGNFSFLTSILTIIPELNITSYLYYLEGKIEFKLVKSNACRLELTKIILKLTKQT